MVKAVGAMAMADQTRRTINIMGMMKCKTTCNHLFSRNSNVNNLLRVTQVMI